MSMPPGPPLIPSDDSRDDALDPDRSPDEADDDTAAAEALGYADPEDAPLTTSGDPEDGDPEGGDRPADGSASEPS